MRRRTLARALLAACALLPAAVFAACGGDAPQTTPDAGAGAARQRVVYAGSNWFGHAPVWAGIAHGIFEQAGFDVEARAFGSSTDRVTALETGTAQFASVGEVAMLEAMAQDRRGFYWIGNQDIAPGNEGLVAIRILRIEDLRGKRIAVNLNSSVHITLYELLKSKGLSIKTDVKLVHGADRAVVDLVRNGDADAGIIWEPYFSELRQLPGAVLLGRDSDTSIFKRFGTMTGPDMVCASKAWVDEDAQRAKRFFRAYFEAVRWCKEHPEELVQLIAERVGRPQEEVARAMANFVWLDGDYQFVAMSDSMLFAQAEYASQALLEMDLIQTLPDFRAWTRPDVLAR